MLSAWLPKILLPALIVLVLVLFRRFAPPRGRMVRHQRDELQVPERLPSGMVTSAMWSLRVVLALQFFVLRGLNHFWASLEGPSLLTQYAPQVVWCFVPAFATLAVPWPLTVWYLRRVGRWQEADTIEDEADSKGRMNTFRVTKWLSVGLVGPIALFTFLAIPIHLSIGDSEVRVGHYASVVTERFPLNEARRLTIIDGYRLRDGNVRPAKDVILDFADGRRLRANQIGDGGTDVPNDVMELLILKTDLAPEHALTEEDVPPLSSSR
jgi:hypothetical protein